MDNTNMPSVQSLSGKRVLFGITKSNGGGAQEYVRMMAQGASEAGADVCVMAGGADGRGGAPGVLFEELAALSIRTLPLSSVQRDIGLRAEWKALQELISLIKTERPAVLHLNSSKMGFLGGIAGRMAGVRTIIFTVHGWPHKEQRPLLWKLMAWLGSWLTVTLSHQVICVSEQDLRDSPTLLFRQKLKFIHNGVPEFAPLSRDEARSEFAKMNSDIAKYPQLLMMNAELHPNKGISTAIRALAELSEHYPELALVVCGEGAGRIPLTNLAEELEVSDRVFLLGYVKEARKYLKAADVFLMPSRKEGLPLALLEAGRAARPIIASKVGGIPEIITDQKTGLFMPRGNTHILAKAISYLLTNPELAHTYGTALQTYVEEHFSMEEMITKTLALY